MAANTETLAEVDGIGAGAAASIRQAIGKEPTSALPADALGIPPEREWRQPGTPPDSAEALAIPAWGGGILERQRGGAAIRVTTLERTLVDVLDVPRHGGGWEETWRSLESVEFLDLDAVIASVLALDRAVAVAKVGFFLEQHRGQLMVEDHHLDRLRAHAPMHPMYLERGKREVGRLLPGWNLVVPERVIDRRWAEVT